MARKMKVDFTGVESYQRVSEGIHRAKISEIQEKTSQGGDPMLQIAFEVIKGDDKGNKVFDSLVLTDKALWKFKSLLQVLNMKCEGKVAVDLDNMIGKVLDINVIHEEYNGVTRAKISEYTKANDSKSSVDDDDDDEDEDDFDEENEDEEEEAPKSKKKSSTVKKTPAKKKSQPEPEEDEEDDWDEDEDEEEEEEKPAPKKKAAAKKPAAKKPATKKKPAPAEEDDDDDDDDDWEED
jgi:hypothetical protein